MAETVTMDVVVLVRRGMCFYPDAYGIGALLARRLLFVKSGTRQAETCFPERMAYQPVSSHHKQAMVNRSKTFIHSVAGPQLPSMSLSQSAITITSKVSFINSYPKPKPVF
jgi:hypothetical protein